MRTVRCRKIPWITEDRRQITPKYASNRHIQGWDRMARKRIAVWILIAAAVASSGCHSCVWPASLAAALVRPFRVRSIRRDTDTHKQSPIPRRRGDGYARDRNRQHSSPMPQVISKSLFPARFCRERRVNLSFRHPDYNTLDLEVPIQFRSSLRQLVVAAMTPPCSCQS